MIRPRDFVVAVLLAVFSSFAPAMAQTANTATLTGTVKSTAGAPIAGAAVSVSGAASASTTTDASGAFSLSLVPGLYRVEVEKGGFIPASLTDVALFANGSTPVTVTLTTADLTSLRTIATVSTSRGSSINTGTSTVAFVPKDDVQKFANPQINDVLQHLPNTTVQHLGSQPDTTIVLGGVQPYETQVLIDGHPLSMGQFGVWLSEYYSSFLIGGIETQVGPGNTTPFANTAVGGTTNLLSPGFTSKPSSEYVIGTDSFGSQYSHALFTGASGKLQYVAGLGYGSSNGPFFQGKKCVVLPDNPANDNTPNSVGILQFCDDSSGSLFTKGEVLKFRYNFSPALAFDAGFIGAQGGYLPQGTSYGQYLGVTKIVQCLPSAPLLCSNPNNSGLIGQSIDAYAWYPGSNVFSNQPIFTGQLRASAGKDTVLVRPYAGNIERIIAGADEQNYPFVFGPPGGPNPAFENYCNPLNDGFLGFLKTTPPTVVNGQEECWQTVFNEFEQDKLYGTTLSYLHPINNGLLNFTYDYHGDSTFAYYNTPDDIATPRTTERYTTLSLTGDVQLTHKLSIKAGLYDTIWKLAGVQPQPGATPDPVTGAVPLTSLTRTVSRFDPHVGFVYQPTGNAAYRIAYGTSATYPFSAQVSGLPFFTPPSATFPGGFITQKNPFLNPETSTEINVGTDLRFKRGDLLSVDLENINIQNVFETLTTPNAIPVPGQAVGIALIQPINAARLKAQFATIRYAYAPRFGFGYNAAVAFEKSSVDGIPASFYAGGAALPANGQQICGFGQATPGSTTCIPYLKGYGQLTFTARDGTYAGIGMDFEGKNNTYFQPPFSLWDLTVRRPVRSDLDVQVAVQNLFNTNNFYNLAMPNKGVTTVAGSLDASNQFQLTSLPSVRVPAPPRTIRLELRFRH